MFKKLQFSDISLIFKSGLLALKRKFWWHVLPTLALSIVTVLIMFAIYHGVDINSATFSIGFSVATFMILNFIISLILLNNCIAHECNGETGHFSSLKKLFIKNGVFVLVVIISLIELMPSLVFATIVPYLQDQTQLRVASLILQLVMFVFGVVGLFSLIINLRTGGQFKPFHLVKLSIKFILQNFMGLLAIHIVTVILFMAINFAFAAGIYLQLQSLLIVLLLVQFLVNLLIMIWGVLVADNCVRLQ